MTDAPKPVDGLEFTETRYQGVDGRPLYRVWCSACFEVVHSATARPDQVAEAHVRHCAPRLIAALTDIAGIALAFEHTPGEPDWRDGMTRIADRALAATRGR